MSNTDTSTQWVSKDEGVRHGGWNGKSSKADLSNIKKHNLSLTLGWKQARVSAIRSMAVSSKPASFALCSRSSANTSTPRWKPSCGLQSTLWAHPRPGYKQSQRCNRRGTAPSTPDWPFGREDSPLSCCKNKPCWFKRWEKHPQLTYLTVSVAVLVSGGGRSFPEK